MKSLLWLLAATTVLPVSAADSVLNITRKEHHLRSGTGPEWEEFQKKKPEGSKLELRFLAQSNPTTRTLIIEQSDVKQEWPVRLNGTNLGKLFLMEAPLVHVLAVPPGTLRNGQNILSIHPPKENDDILVGAISLKPGTISEAIGEAQLQVEVTENGLPVPCRITITRRDFTLAAITAKPGQNIAIRPGVIYSGNGRAQVGVVSGRYAVFASRGPEYSVATRDIKVRAGQISKVALSLKREVPTPGLVSCDTHIHTWSLSKHGDATLDERILTLSGEGIELPVATDHNLVIDYSGFARSNHVERYFTAIAGDEVTTSKGHFNGFPMSPEASVPDPKTEPWPKLIETIRATPGVQMIVLNHPTDTHTGFCPFAPTNFNRVTGENLRGFDFTFDGVELVNSGALRSDLMETFRCWFALLNYGYRITGVGASDSHDVSRFIVGQGRTYIKADDHDPASINIEEACQNLRGGRASISLGLITDIRVNDRFGIGDLATNLGPTINITVDVWGASWARADHLELYANGSLLKEVHVIPTSNPQKGHFSWTFPRPVHDQYLVAVATGPGIISPHWAIPRPYQPNDLKWTSRILGATNPVWLDSDGNGKFTAAREYARQIVERVGTNPANLIAALANFDEATAAQAASFCSAKGVDPEGIQFQAALKRAPLAVRSGFRAYVQTSKESHQGEK